MTIIESFLEKYEKKYAYYQKISNIASNMLK